MLRAAVPRRPGDFPLSVQHLVAQRAGQMCSNPGCRDVTSGPHSDPARAINTGEAAHICAAQPGGPRYDPNQTPAERRSIENAIWLCRKCAALIDRDQPRFTTDVLRDWKRQHELFVSRGAPKPTGPKR